MKFCSLLNDVYAGVVQIFLLSCIPANFWHHTIVITTGYKAGLISPPKQQCKCQNNFKWSTENSFLQHPLKADLPKNSMSARRSLTSNHDTVVLKNTQFAQLKQPVLHKVVTKKIISFSLGQGKILHDQSWLGFFLPIQTVKTQSEPPSISKTGGRQFCRLAEDAFVVSSGNLQNCSVENFKASLLQFKIKTLLLLTY